MRILSPILLVASLAIFFWLKNGMKTADKSLTVAIPAYWGATLPPLQHSAFGAVVLDNQFEPLVRRGNNGLIEPLGAKSWEISRDYRVVTFKIDATRRFSDGSRLTASDFKRSWEDGLRMKPKSKNQSVADILYGLKGFQSFAQDGTISGVRVLADDTLELEFDKPVRLGVEYLSGHRYSAYKMIDGRGIGTGPYAMEEKDKTLYLTPNPYYAAKEPRFEKLKIVVIAPEKLHESLRSGAVDAAVFVEKSNLPECLDETRGNIRCVYSQEADHVDIEVNGLSGRLFSDRRHRLALQALIHDRLEADGLPPQLRATHLIKDTQSLLTFQPGRLSDNEARDLVEQGRPYIPELLKASKKQPVYLVCGRDCAWLIALLGSAGVKLSAKSGRTDFTKIQEMSYKTHEADLIFGTFSVYNGDPDGLYHVLGRKGAIFSPMTDREGISDLLEEGRAILERPRLAAHYAKVARAILNEVPYVHIGFSGRGVAYNIDKARVSESFVNRNNHRVTLFEPR